VPAAVGGAHDDVAAADVSFCGSGGLESLFIRTLGPNDTDAPVIEAWRAAARAATVSADTMARTPLEMPPGYRWMCKIQRGVAAA
jgi:hypothetical protein